MVDLYLQNFKIEKFDTALLRYLFLKICFKNKAIQILSLLNDRCMGKKVHQDVRTLPYFLVPDLRRPKREAQDSPK